MQYAPAPAPREEKKKSHGCLMGWSVLPRSPSTARIAPPVRRGQVLTPLLVSRRCAAVGYAKSRASAVSSASPAAAKKRPDTGCRRRGEWGGMGAVICGYGGTNGGREREGGGSTAISGLLPLFAAPGQSAGISRAIRFLILSLDIESIMLSSDLPNYARRHCFVPAAEPRRDLTIYSRGHTPGRPIT